MMERIGFEQWKPREVARLLALIETERRYYQEMMASLPVALAVVSQDRTVVSVNRAFRSLVQLPTAELRQKTIEQVIPSEELVERIRAVHVEALARPFSLTFKQRSFRAALVPLRSWEDDGGPETLIMLEDLGGIAAAAPSAGVDLSSFPAIFWHADAATLRFTYAGGAADEILGYPAAHWLATPGFFAQRIHPDDRDAVMALYSSAIAGGGQASAEFRALSASGDSVWCRESIRGLQPGRVSGVLTAIGDRRQMDQQQVAAARIDALRELSARLAHDLNNPLMIVSGYAEEVQNSLPEDDPLRNNIIEILVATARMSELSSHLLDLARVRAAAPSPVSFHDLAASLRARLRQTAGSSVKVELTGDENLAALAEKDQLEEAVVALASRAIENTRNPFRLTVSFAAKQVSDYAAAATLKPGRYAAIRIHVAGEGMGVTAGILESVLPAKDAPKTAGPAAARAYTTIRQWGGDVAFSSDPELGSVFDIRLPEPEGEKPAVVHSGPARILIAEDEPGIRSLMSRILRREGYEVLVASSGEEAHTIASGPGRIDVLVTDIVLPGMSGRELAESVHRTRPETRIVYVSGFTDDQAVLQAQSPRGAMFLQKPFTLAALTGKIREALAHRGA